MSGKAKKKKGIIEKVSCFFWLEFYNNARLLLVGTCLSDSRIFSALGIDHLCASCSWPSQVCQYCLGIYPRIGWPAPSHAVALVQLIQQSGLWDCLQASATA